MTKKYNLQKKEVTLDFALGVIGDAQFALITNVNSRWSKGNFPKNLTETRASHRTSKSVHIDLRYRRGLRGLEVGMKTG